MLNLHEVRPDIFTENEVVDVNLDALYKQHAPHSHIAALEMIFAEGVRYSGEAETLKRQLTDAENRHKTQFVELLNLHDEVKKKYEALLVKISNPQPNVSEAEVQRQVIAQTMGMGKSLL